MEKITLFQCIDKLYDFFLHVWVLCLQVYLFIIFLASALRGQMRLGTRVPDGCEPLVGAGHQVQVHCSLLISHFSSPFKNKQEMGLLHVQGWPGVGHHLPVVSQCCTDGHVPVSLGFLFLFINHELMENVSQCFLSISGYPDVFFY